MLAKAHLKVRRARLDFCHESARAIVDRFDVIAVERLNVKNMTATPKAKPDPDTEGRFLPNGAGRKAGLSKSILDAGWSVFVSILAHEAASAGREFHAVHAASTSRDCSCCGARVPKILSVRAHLCPHCGFEAHRDHNAAVNILQKACKAASARSTENGEGIAFRETATPVAA